MIKYWYAAALVVALAPATGYPLPSPVTIEREAPAGGSVGHQTTVALVLMAADWVETREWAASGRMRELNPLLGPRPSRSDVDRHFAISLLTWLFLQHSLNRSLAEEHRRITIMLEWSCVASNAKLVCPW